MESGNLFDITAAIQVSSFTALSHSSYNKEKIEELFFWEINIVFSKKFRAPYLR